MKQIFSLENLDCANCAAKMERKIAAIDGVIAVSISFFAQKMVLEAEDGKWDTVVAQACRAISAVDSDCRVLIK